MYTFNHYYLTTHLSHKSWRDSYLAYPVNEPDYGVVLKVFAAECIEQTTTAKDIRLLETRLQSLKHPFIVAVLELAIEQGKLYLVSEYQTGGSLRHYLDQQPSGHLPLDEAVEVVMRIGQAAAFAHTQGIVHQDIRPENILLNDQGKVLLADFDLGGVIQEPGLKSRSDRRAVSYLSPEQTVGVVSPASDQYALGCLLYELVTGTFLNPVSLRQYSTLMDSAFALPPVPMLPYALETVILRALAMRPEERYPDVLTFLTELKLAAQPDVSVASSIPVSYKTFSQEERGLPSMMESGSVPALNLALGAHASITSFDEFSQLDDTKNVPEVVLLEYFVEEKERHTAASEGAQMVALTSQEAPSTGAIEVQSPIIVQALPGWKRPAVVFGAALTLIVIAFLVTYSFGSRVLPGVKRVPSLAVSTTAVSTTAVSTTMTRKAAISSTSTPPTTGPMAQATRAPASGISPKPVLPKLTSSKKLVPPTTPIFHGVGSVQIDVGGSGAGSFVGDEDFSNITSGRPSSDSNDRSGFIDTSSVSNPAPQSVYQSARVGDCLYTISHLTPHASYTVRLHFAETYWTQPGKRTFNVILNAQLVLRNFDIFATAGAENKAVVEQFVIPADSTGTITIQFATVKNNALINAIEVLAV